MEINDTGLAEFTYTKNKFKGYFKGMGKIIDIDTRFILFRDNDAFEYIVERTKFKIKTK